MNANCTARDVRLTGGQSSAEGHVEICVNSVWGSVCDDSWEDNDAAVVCQELGFQGNGMCCKPTIMLNSIFNSSLLFQP